MSKLSTPTLLEIQVWMKDLLTNPKGVEEALLKSSQWIDIIASDESSNISRLDIYAEAYFARILEAFIIDFPITFFALGEDQFAKLVAEYLKLYPSTENNLNNISKSIVPFIKIYSTSSAIHDIVTLERLAIESFYSSIDPIFDPQSLSVLEESDWRNIKFNLNSSLRLFSSSWPLEELWEKRHNIQKLSIQENNEINHYIIERISHHITLSKLTSTQFIILQKINEGERLISIGDEIANISEEDVSVLFADWIQKSYFKNYYF